MNIAAGTHGEGSGGGNNVGDGEEPSTAMGGGDGDHQRTSASAGAAAGGTQAPSRGGGQGVYGKEEVSALKGIFDLYDAENTGTIGVKELEGILQKVGHNPGECVALSKTCVRHQVISLGELILHLCALLSLASFFRWLNTKCKEFCLTNW